MEKIDIVNFYLHQVPWYNIEGLNCKNNYNEKY